MLATKDLFVVVVVVIHVENDANEIATDVESVSAVKWLVDAQRPQFPQIHQLRTLWRPIKATSRLEMPNRQSVFE
jgi:hypothetical protein